MNLDIFVTKDGRCLVSELQTLFGMGYPYEMCVVNGQPGRMVYEAESGDWRFEAGSFCQNYMCNLRVESLLEMLGRSLNTL